MFGAEISVDETGWTEKNFIDALDFDDLVNTGVDITVRCTLEHNSSATTIKSNWQSETPQLMRLQWNGKAITQGSGSYSTQVLRFDAFGYWTDVEALGEDDGNDIIVATFKPAFSSTDSLYAEFLLVVEDSDIWA